MDFIRNNITLASSQQHDYKANFDVSAVEYNERVSRMDNLQIAHDQAHARMEANLVKAAVLDCNKSAPILGAPMAASRRYTRRAEEAERLRRVASKSECALRRRNACRTAHMISSLGWPLISYNKAGLVCIIVCQTTILCEAERQRRMNDTVQGFISRTNAALISNLIRWHWSSQANAAFVVLKTSHVLEERERARRLADRELMSLQSHNAYLVSRLIKALGWPFYVQPVIVEKETALQTLGHIADDVKDVTAPALNNLARGASKVGYFTLGAAVTAVEAAQDSLPAAKQTAQNVLDTVGKGASAVGLLTLGAAVCAFEKAEQVLPSAWRAAGHAAEDAMHAIKDGSIALAESTAEAIQQARDHVVAVTAMIPSHVDTVAELEEKERKYRLKHALQNRIHASYESSLIWTLHASPALIEYLCETERAWRCADIAGQDVARQNALQVSKLISNHWNPGFVAVETFELLSVPQAIRHIPAAPEQHTALVPGPHVYRATKDYITVEDPAPFAAHDSVEQAMPHAHASRVQLRQPMFATVESVAAGPYTAVWEQDEVLVPQQQALVQPAVAEPVYAQCAPVMFGLPVACPAFNETVLLDDNNNVAAVVIDQVQPVVQVQPVALEVEKVVTVTDTYTVPVAAPLVQQQAVISQPIVQPIVQPVVQPIVQPIVQQQLPTLVQPQTAAPTLAFDPNNYAGFYDFNVPHVATVATVPVASYGVQQQQQQQNSSLKGKLQSITQRFHAGSSSM